MKYVALILLTAFLTLTRCELLADPLKPGHVELLCHRTANEDVPENTLESLEQAALLGCDVVEIDLRKTLDGVIVLNHDGFLERLTDGIGETEKSLYGDLQLRDAGGWMGGRFEHIPMATFVDALRLAKEHDIRLILDIKTKGIGADVLMLVEREGMLERVQFGGEWSDVKAIDSHANEGTTVKWVQPGVTPGEVNALHQSGKAVIANFSANEHGMDLKSMKAAVAAGVDGINVDYPRLGADAVGHPVEQKLAMLSGLAERGEPSAQLQAILALSRYRGFPLQDLFARLLKNPDNQVSRAAALALLAFRPAVSASLFVTATHSDHADVRANASWALGMLRGDANQLMPLLGDEDPLILQEVLLAIARMHGPVAEGALLPLLAHPDSRVRGAAAMALAQHQPQTASKAIPAQLKVEVRSARVLYESYVRRGKPQLSAEEIATITGYFRCQMKMVQAISQLKGSEAIRSLEEEAFRPGDDFSQMNGVVAGFQLWDRLAENEDGSQTAIEALSSTSATIADRAEWMLIQAGVGVLPRVRLALDSENSSVRERAMHIVAWHGDTSSIEHLQNMLQSDPEQAQDIQWALLKIAAINRLGNTEPTPATGSDTSPEL
jgi:glycerophosphoryl diester phosphodiesterase/HEAT repeat protein